MVDFDKIYWKRDRWHKYVSSRDRTDVIYARFISSYDEPRVVWTYEEPYHTGPTEGLNEREYNYAITEDFTDMLILDGYRLDEKWLNQLDKLEQ
jgi:hypothetical protein